MLDPSKCQGHGICTLMAPELIELDEWGYARLVPFGSSTGRPKSAARAVRSCPEGALSLMTVDEPFPGHTPMD